MSRSEVLLADGFVVIVHLFLQQSAFTVPVAIAAVALTILEVCLGGRLAVVPPLTHDSMGLAVFHRILGAELSVRVTVLRDGRVRGSAEVRDITDDELLAWWSSTTVCEDEAGKLQSLLGGPENLMVGRVVWDEMFSSNNWPRASALAVVIDRKSTRLNSSH